MHTHTHLHPLDRAQGLTQRWAPPAGQLPPSFGQSSVPHHGAWLTRPAACRPKATQGGLWLHTSRPLPWRRGQGHPPPSPKPVTHGRSAPAAYLQSHGRVRSRGLPVEQAGNLKTSVRVLLSQALGAWSCGTTLARGARGRGFNAGDSPGASPRDQERNRPWHPPAGWSPILSNLGRAV